ncbi:Retrotransposon-derived protein peg10 [Basidiobolus ranarum]|uniref:Retrotransposon-derived protein peg10 n=1 Tax=Basidiobolus ranarum TaxID=34480 RepID=A0ABR2VKB7_9FUNG
MKLMSTAHQEEIAFDIISSTHHPGILGISWLMQHNPVFNWKKKIMMFKQIPPPSPYLPTCKVSNSSPTQILKPSIEPIFVDSIAEELKPTKPMVHKLPPKYNYVWLLWKNTKFSRPCDKLDHKRLGPFKIISKGNQ